MNADMHILLLTFANQCMKTEKTWSCQQLQTERKWNKVNGTKQQSRMQMNVHRHNILQSVFYLELSFFQLLHFYGEGKWLQVQYICKQSGSFLIFDVEFRMETLIFFHQSAVHCILYKGTESNVHMLWQPHEFSEYECPAVINFLHNL